MNPDKYKTIPFNVGDLFGDHRFDRMGGIARAFYVLLLLRMWAYDKTQSRIKDDDKEISKLLKIPRCRWVAIRREIQWPDDPIFKEENGYLVSARLASERKAKVDYSVKQSNSAKGQSSN